MPNIKSAKKRVLTRAKRKEHKNKAAREKSRLTKLKNNME